ncbi:MAG: ACT domain-containing protein [Ferruginibacter sp.]
MQVPAMNERLQEVVNASWFTIEDEVYIYTSVKQLLYPEKHLVVVQDNTEITVVTAESNLQYIGEYEANKEKWRLLNIRCGKPFYCVGFIAYITGKLAEAGIDIVLVSSFSNDLVLVMENDFAKSVTLLQSIGFEKRGH